LNYIVKPVVCTHSQLWMLVWFPEIVWQNVCVFVMYISCTFYLSYWFNCNFGMCGPDLAKPPAQMFCGGWPSLGHGIGPPSCLTAVMHACWYSVLGVNVCSHVLLFTRCSSSYLGVFAKFILIAKNHRRLFLNWWMLFKAVFMCFLKKKTWVIPFMNPLSWFDSTVHSFSCKASGSPW